jgi:hypothetical protein
MDCNGNIIRNCYYRGWFNWGLVKIGLILETEIRGVGFVDWYVDPCGDRAVEGVVGCE